MAPNSLEQLIVGARQRLELLIQKATDASVNLTNPSSPAEGLLQVALSDWSTVLDQLQTQSCRPLGDEERWKFALEGSGDGVWDWNVQTNEVFFSQRWKEMLGFTDAEIGSDLSEWDRRVHPDEKAMVYEAIEQHLCGATDQYVSEHRVLCKDGTYKWILDRGRVTSRTEDGQPLRVIGTHTDISQQKATEAALKTSEQRFRSLSESAPIGIFQTDKEGRCLYTNTRWQEIAGLSQEQSLGVGWVTAVHPDDAAWVAAEWHTAVQAGREFVLVEFRFQRPTGEICWVRAQAAAIQDEQGHLVGYVGTTEDISNRKQAENELRQREAFLRSIYYGADQAIFVVDVIDNDFYYAGFNPLAERYSGICHQDIQGKTPEAVFGPEIGSHFRQHYDRCLQAGSSISYEEYLVLETHTIATLTTLSPIRNEQGEIYRLVGTATDISDRKQAEQKIQEQAELLNITTDAIFVRDLDNQITFWNPGAERLYGWSAAEAIQQNAENLLAGHADDLSDSALQITLERTLWQGELQQVTRTGQSVIVDRQMTLIQDAMGSPTSILTVDTDITEKKQLERQFLRAQRLESIGTLASGIAHDLNNILTPILATAQLLPLKFPHADDQIKQLLTMQEASAKRGAALVKQVLSFVSGIEGKRDPCHIPTLLTEIQQVIQQTFPRSIAVVADLPTDLWLVSGDITQIHQIMMNLCINARDAMPTGGTLRLSAHNMQLEHSKSWMASLISPGRYVEITIADTGTGIPVEIIDRIFEPFFTTKEHGKGTGLGLASVVGILKSHRGWIDVVSEAEAGTEFKVFLPAAEPNDLKVTDPKSLVGGNAEVILVIDDEEMVRLATQTSLETLHYQVLPASNGSEAIALYSQYQTRIRLVLTDMMMPLMSGEATIQALRAINPQVKIVAVSGLLANQPLAIAAGATAFLAKPYTTEELFHTIHAVLQD